MEVLIFLIGFTGTFIGTLAGGGGLISLPAMLAIGIPIHSAIAANKFSNTLSSFSSFFKLLREKKVTFKRSLIIAPFSLFGGIAGGFCATLISEKTMTAFAIILLCFALVLHFIKKPKVREDGSLPIKKQAYPALFGIGFYDGVFGPGQGTLLMYTFLHQGVSYITAIAYSRFQTFLSCLGATLIYYHSGHINWDLTLFLAAGSLTGAQVSLIFAKKISAAYLKVILRSVTLLLIIQLTLRLV